MPDQLSGNGNYDEGDPPAEISPIMPGRGGRPSFSLEALRELIERQFQAETAHRADILLDLDTEAKRRDLLNEVADYVLGVEAVTLATGDRAKLIDKAYRNLFTFGPLDAVLADNTVTYVTINGPYDVHVRRGMGPLEKIAAVFDDRAHLANILARVLATGGAVLSPHDPFLEAGMVLAGRPARISVVGPPVSPDYSLEIRLHPRDAVTLGDFVTRFNALPSQAESLLAAILDGGHGLLIVGDVGLGKTTLAEALAARLVGPEDAGDFDDATSVIAVERAPEMILPPGITRRTPIPPTPDDPGTTFEEEIIAGLEQAPATLIVDEIRGDEAAAVWQALIATEDAPRYVWVFRGDPRPDRLRSVLGMVIRRRDQAIPQAAIHSAIARHLPFVIAFKRVNDSPRLELIAEWVADEAGEALELRPLLWAQDGAWITAESPPARGLGLPSEFWTQTQA